MQKTKIEWADYTWNPVTGCYNNCEYCYARKTAQRYGGSTYGEPLPHAKDGIVELEYPFFRRCKKGGMLTQAGFPFYFAPTLYKYRLGDPQKKKRPQTIFVCSMADLFGDWVPDEWIQAVFEASEQADQHRYLFLTKYPARYCKLDDAGQLPHKENWWYGSTWTKPGDCVFEGGVGTIRERFNTFLSVEPLLAEMDTAHGIGCFNWIIIGAETGKRAGKVTPKREWVERIVQEADRVEIPVFMKDSLLPIMGEEGMRREFPWAEE